MTAPLVVLVTGGTGQVGHELVRDLAPLGRVHAPSRVELDLGDVDSIRRYVRAVQPNLVVNAGAYTAVDAAESDVERATAVNVEAPRALAAELERTGGCMVHFSTDYVFDGASARPYREDDETGALSVYGRSKLEGERAVRDSGVAHVILRASWVYGLRGRNFLQTMLRLAREREELRVVDDQVGAPTWSRMISAATAAIVARLSKGGNLADEMRAVHGIYHLTASDATSWHGFASEALALDPRKVEQRCRVIEPIPTSEYPLPAQRPANSRLDSSRVATTFGIRLPSWREQLVLALGA